jgi:hypothetical protein
MSLKYLAVAAVLSTLTGCMSSQAEVDAIAKNLTYPEKPTDSEIMVMADAQIRKHLKDPDSLKNLVLTDSFKCYASKIEFSDNISPKYNYGYWCYRFNYQATNSYGGYVRGFTPLLYVDGQLHELPYQGEVIRKFGDMRTAY